MVCFCNDAGMIIIKCAAVTPIPKKNPPNNIENDIRPLSLTCQIAKILEGFTLNRILPTILPQLDNKQFAVAGKSPEQAVVYILYLALEALDRGSCSLRMFFADFCKGFDLIDHKILLTKLSKFNIHNSLLRWIGSFLTWSLHCDYIIKKANKRLYALRNLKKAGVSCADIVTVYCVMIRTVLEYASAVFANLPQILSNDLERVERRALAIIYPTSSYRDALLLAGIQSLNVRRDIACKKFIASIKLDNPLYPFIHKHSRILNHTYSLRSERIDRTTVTRTDRFQNFVTVKFSETYVN